MRLVLLSALLLGTVSCSEVSAPSVHGSVSFTYTGAGGGTFSASGDPPVVGSPTPGTSWSVGYIEAGNIDIGGARPRSAGRIDLAILRLNRTTAGSATVDLTCDIDGSANCTGMTLFLNFNPDGDAGDFFCALTSGTIVVTEISSTRAKGTFSGNGNCSSGTGGASSAFAVTSGTFDVAMVAPPS